MNLTEGGAFYSQTPESCLEDLGVNKGVKNYVILSKNCGEEKQPKNFGEGSQNLANLVNKKILKRVQDDVYGCHSERSEESQSRSQKMVSPLTPIPSPNERWVMKPAFTLAEILVTLGVIGIVVAMTLPMLARNYQFYIRQQQFKKAYAALEIAVQKTQIDMGEGVRCFWLNNSWEDGNWYDCDYFFSELAKNFKLIQICERNAFNKGCIPKDFRGGDIVYAQTQGGDDLDAAKGTYNYSCGGFSDEYIRNNNLAYVTNSGFTIIQYPVNSRKEIWSPTFLLDINAHKGPNKWGHDIFVFMLQKKNKRDSIFRLNPTDKCHALDFGGYYTKHFFEYLYGQNAEL